MKDIKNYITETKISKYCINFFNKLWDKRLTNDWKKEISQEPISSATYWDVMDMSSWNFSEPEGLVAWHGKDGYWANVYDDSKNPDKAPKWATIFKGRDLEKIERCKQ